MPLVVVAVAWLAQGATLRNGWVWDDAILVRDGRVVAQGVSAVPALLAGTWGGGDGQDVGLWRPLVGASLAVQAQLHGTENPFPFHLVNLFLHGLAAVMLLALAARAWPGRPAAAAAAALLFAAHPVHTGTVSWIVARGDLLAAVFSLAAALAWTRRRGLDAAAAVLSSVLLFLALLSKEMAAGVPLVLWMLDAGLRGVSLREALRRRWAAYAGLGAAVALWFALRQGATGGLAAAAAHAPLADRSLLERLFVGAGALVRAAWKTLLPAGLTGDASTDPVLRAGAPLPAAYAASAFVVALVLLGIAARRLRGRTGPLGACVAAFVALSLPVLQIVPFGAAFEDRYAYLPSLALLPALGLAVEPLLRARPRALALAPAVAALAALVPACWAVAAEWRDDEAFERALIADEPGHVRALDRLGRLLLLDAQALRRRLETMPPTGEAVKRPLRDGYAGRVSEALRLLERARAQPGAAADARVLRTLADAYLEAGKWVLAEATYADLLRVKRVRLRGRWVPQGSVDDVRPVLPSDREAMAQIWGNVAIAWKNADGDDLARVARAQEAAAAWDPPPGDFERQRMAAAAHMAQPRKDFARALDRLDRALTLAPPAERADLTRMRADILGRARGRAAESVAAGRAALERPGGHGEALDRFLEAASILPTYAAAHAEAARVYRYKGDFRSALDALERARAALDATGAAADDPLRRDVEALRRRYEQERDQE